MHKGSKHGLYHNIHAKRKRIAEGSGEKMRKVGSKGSPTKKAFKNFFGDFDFAIILFLLSIITLFIHYLLLTNISDPTENNSTLSAELFVITTPAA